MLYNLRNWQYRKINQEQDYGVSLHGAYDEVKL
jgi:hypothetical protein